MKRLIGALLCAFALLALPAVALAKDMTGASNWQVTYTSGGALTDNFNSDSALNDAISALEPGDTITLTIRTKQENATPTDWYMRNSVIRSLEDSSKASGGAYTYHLEYKGANGSSSTIYDSSTVGGEYADYGQGLNEATSGLEDYFYLEQYSQGQGGQVVLTVGLDGETQGNAYFTTQADLQMQFAVEPQPTGSNKRTELVRTGDETKLFPLYMAMVASGVLFAALALQGIRLRKQEKEDAR